MCQAQSFRPQPVLFCLSASDQIQTVLIKRPFSKIKQIDKRSDLTVTRPKSLFPSGTVYIGIQHT